MDLLAYFYKNYPQRTILAFLAITVAGAVTGVSISALLPLLNKAFADDPSAATEFDKYFLMLGINPTFINLLIFIVFGVILKSILLSGANIYAGFTVAKIIKDLRHKLLKAMSCAEWRFFTNQPGGKIAASLMYESDRAGSGYMNSLNILSTLTQIIAYLSVAIFVSWPIVILALFTSLLLAVLLNNFIVINKRLGEQITLLSRDITAKLTDSTRSIKSLKAMARETHSNTLLDSYTKQLKTVAKKGVLSSNLLSMFQEIILAIAIACGVYISLKNFETSVEAVIVLTIAFSRSVKLFAKAQKQYQVLSNQISGYHGIIDSIRNAQENCESRSGTKQVQLSTNIVLNNITFSHDENPILKDSDATIYHKKINTIIGISGAGKTTLIDLICGLYTPSEGNILIGDTDLINIDIKHWRKQIGYVVQENNLLNTSIRENITLGDNKFSEEDINIALEKSHSTSFVFDLPEKINTTVGDNGTKLSGGQRQRILIARALVHSPKLLILDEATSALDSETEKSLSEVFKELSKEITIISVSHRPALVEISDHIIELKDKILIQKK